MDSKYSNKETIIQAIRDKVNGAFEYIHEMLFETVRYMITSNKGSEQDAEDLYQEAIICLTVNLDDQNYKIKENFSGYFIGICRKMWIDKLRDRSRESFFDDTRSPDVLSDRMDRNLQRDKQQDLFWTILARLKRECQKIIKYRLDKTPYSEIATSLGLTAATVRTKKYECNKKLNKLIKEDPRYSELRN